MVTLNKVMIVGNLTKDPELRYTPQGTAVVTLRLAANTPYKDKTGQMQKNTCFVNVVVWGPMAENCNQYLQKGRPVFVEGQLQSRSWKGQDGQTRNVIEIRAARVQFMSFGSDRSASNSVKPQSEPAKEVDLGQAPEEVVDLGDSTIEELGEANYNG